MLCACCVRAVRAVPQALLIREMVLVGEAARAADLAHQWGLPQHLAGLTPEQVAAEEAAAAAMYLQVRACGGGPGGGGGCGRGPGGSARRSWAQHPRPPLPCPQLPLPATAVEVVDSAEQLPAVAAALAAADALGLDLEWKPNHAPGSSSPASILQVCVCSGGWGAR